MKQFITPIALAAAALLGACASNPTAPASLVSARAAVKAAETDPVVLSAAPLELKKASDSLRNAEQINAKGESLAEIDSASLVASRHAETAVAAANAKRNEEQIKAAELDRERARADQRAMEARAAKADALNAKADAQNARLDAEVAKLETSVAKAQADDAQARAQAAQLAAASAQQQLQSLQARQTERGLLVTLGDVLFEFGRAEIKPGAQDALNKLAQYLASQPDKHVLIEGYTDSVGSDAANLALSQRRADAVAQALSRMGIASNRVIANGLGEANPVADNRTDTNRALNRRVEVYIS